MSNYLDPSRFLPEQKPAAREQHLKQVQGAASLVLGLAAGGRKG